MSNTTFAVMADIHGNYEAFKTCVEDALARGVKKFIFLGDYIGEFPDPQKTMSLLYVMKETYDCYFIKGNKEDYWINRRKGVNCDWVNGNKGVGVLKYCFKSLTDRDIDFFESLSPTMTIEVPECKPLFACHGTPYKINADLFPNDDESLSIIEEMADKLILCGHSHYQLKIDTKSSYALNPGSVGVPIQSGGKTQYMLLKSTAAGWEHEFLSVTYDTEKAIADLEASELNTLAPYWSKITKQVLRGDSITHMNTLLEALRLSDHKYKWYCIPDCYWAQAIANLS